MSIPFLTKRFLKAARKAGDVARDQGDWAAAAKAYRHVLDINPTLFPIHVQLGHMLKESGDLAGARVSYQAAYKLDPDNSDLMRWYGNLDLRNGDYAAAEWKLAHSVKIDGNVDAARDLAVVKSHIKGENPDRQSSPAIMVQGRLVGSIDGMDGDLVFGWAVEPDHPGKPTEVEFRAGQIVVGRATADIVRDDVAKLGGLGFRAQLDLTDLTGDPWISGHLHHTGEELRKSPILGSQRGDQASALFATDVQLEIVKPFVVERNREIALFVSHSRTGVLKPHVIPYLKALGNAGISVLLILVADNPAYIAPDVISLVAGAVVRENRGYDFACWAHVLRLYPQAYSASILYLLNDSVVGPADAQCFAKMLDRVRCSPADVVGLTESYQHQWHVQSYFLALKPHALSSWELHSFFDNLRVLNSKDAIIRKYECRLASLLENAGCSVEVLFPIYSVRDPTVFGWQALLDAGFPFVKVLVLRGSFSTVDTSKWREVLACYGFNVALVEATLSVGTEWWEPTKHFPLLARPQRVAVARGQPLKVAFFGPWNYDNGLGAASRGLIAVIRRCDVQLNLYPLKKPFHVHKAMVPPIDITDFVGTADIAVVHLNPDSWHLLTDTQRSIIMAAHKRIGHWVWEMGHIPMAWRANFSLVDRIWAPSSYCADLFAGEGEAPVDVVPYAVPLAEIHLPPAERTRLLGKFGITPGNRVILYIFDGSSYLVRKNPAALVRAFTASGLGNHGWRLLLKTKHLFDRPTEGHALEALVSKSDGVVLVNASLLQGEVASLIALCDIYASPHCSEGFGLTIAEAMSAGRPVVVTDFGGSTDFVDTTCGYPVLAHPWYLETDFGHYTQGGKWAQVDEPALAKALLVAAAAIERGDDAIARAGQRRVSDKLSYEAIARTIAASFEDTLCDTMPISRPSSRIVSSLSRGISLTEANLGVRLIAVALQSSLAPSKQPTFADLPRDRDHWIVFAPGDAYIPSTFQSIVQEHCQARPDVDVFYADDVALGEERFGEQVRLKPAFDASLLVAKDYIGAPLIVRASALYRLEGLDHAAGAATLTDLVFRAEALGMPIARIPTVLLAWKGKRPRASREERQKAIERLPAFASHYDIVAGLCPDTLRLSYRFNGDNTPSVTVIIPTCRSTLPGSSDACIVHLLEALIETDWPMERLNVLVGDDVAGSPEWETRTWPFTLTRVATLRSAGECFNYAAKMNGLWRLAQTEHLVMMNDDVVPMDAGWLKALLTFAVEERVGGVGARLLYDDDRIQHAGIAPLFGRVAHAWFRLHAKTGRPYQDWPLVHREWSMVTGAVFATRRGLLEQVNGFDERFTLEFNGVDLCLRLRALGYRIVYTPHAELRYAEKVPRGKTLPPGENVALFLERWRCWLAEDPSYHPSLRKDCMDIEPVVETDAWFLS